MIEKKIKYIYFKIYLFRKNLTETLVQNITFIFVFFPLRNEQTPLRPLRTQLQADPTAASWLLWRRSEHLQTSRMEMEDPPGLRRPVASLRHQCTLPWCDVVHRRTALPHWEEEPRSDRWLAPTPHKGHQHDVDRRCLLAGKLNFLFWGKRKFYHVL